MHQKMSNEHTYFQGQVRTANLCHYNHPLTPNATQPSGLVPEHLSLFLPDLLHQVRLRSDKNLCKYLRLAQRNDPLRHI